MQEKESPDPAFAQLLADPRSALRPPSADTPIVDYRRRLDAPLASVRGPDVHSVETLGPEVTGCRSVVRIYRALETISGTIMFIHGGGFVVGSLDSHDAMCRSLALASGMRVVAVGYRLAPEAPFPAALEDCSEALAWADRTQPLPGTGIALCGDSAGGHIALGTALQATYSGRQLAALGLLYPVVDPNCSTNSWQRFGTNHILTLEWMRWAWSAYLGSADASAPEISPMRADLSLLPPTYIVSAGCDPLCDEGEALGAAIAAAGGCATVSRASGMIHGFASLPHLTCKSDTALHELSVHFRQHMC